MDTSSLGASTKRKMKPSHYNAKSFHGVRAISAISAIVVTSILLFFCFELKTDGYKIPWTFLIVLLASTVTLLCLILTTAIHCCTRLSPLFNLILNIPLLILWITGLALFTWNIYGTLSHSCTADNWGNDDGVMICSQYKALFSFVVFGALSQVAAVVVDVRARVAQTRSGRYANLRDSTSEVKLEPYDSTHDSHRNPLHDVAYSAPPSEYRDEPGWRPGQRTTTAASSRYSDHGDIGGRDGQRQVRMNQFNNNDMYHGPAQGMGHESNYGQQGNVGNRY